MRLPRAITHYEPCGSSLCLQKHGFPLYHPLAWNSSIMVYMSAASCADVPVVVEFRRPMSPAQQQWLRTTRVRVRRVAFHTDDAASTALLRDHSTLVGGQAASPWCSWVRGRLESRVRESVTDNVKVAVLMCTNPSLLRTGSIDEVVAASRKHRAPACAFVFKAAVHHTDLSSELHSSTPYCFQLTRLQNNGDTSGAQVNWPLGCQPDAKTRLEIEQPTHCSSQGVTAAGCLGEHAGERGGCLSLHRGAV